MKKLLPLIFAGVLAVCSVGMAACGAKSQHEHTYTVKTEVGATCTEGAYTLMECECGDSYKEYDKNSQALGHDFIYYMSDGNTTCTEDGTKTAKCTRCDETDTVPEEAYGHYFSYYEENNDETCIEAGTKTATCEICGEHDVLPVPALGHLFINYVSDNNATCTEYGTQTAQCERCEETNTVIDLASKLPHNYVNGICADCGAEEGEAALEYQLAGGTYSVVGIGTVTSSDIVIPAEYNGRPVTSIASGAFGDCKDVTSVTISEGITSIGMYAFLRCTNLTTVNIPDSVISIGVDAFYGTALNATELDGVIYLEISDNPYFLLYDGDSVQSCTVHEDTKFIAGEAFVGNKELNSIVIPDGVVGIGDSAFARCDGLTFVTFGSGLKVIEARAFEDCNSITSLAIPEGVTVIKQSAFSYCTSLENITLPDSLTKLEDFALPYNANSLKYNEYNNALYLGNESNPYLVLVEVKSSDVTSCTVNENTKFIHNSAFYNSKITSVTIPNSVVGINSMAFGGCENLSSVTFGNNLQYIGGNAFAYCKKLQKVTLPDSLTELGGYAFIGCSTLNNLTLSSNLTIIGFCVFKECYSLTSVTIPDGVTQIGLSAFEYCMELKNVNIPDSVIYVGSDAFLGCDKLNFNLYDTGLYLGNTGNPYLVLVDVNSNIITGCDVHNDTKIIAGAFSGCMKLQKITLPAGVTIIVGHTFVNCYALKEIEYGGTVEEWDKMTTFSKTWGFSDSLKGCTVQCTDGNIGYVI